MIKVALTNLGKYNEGCLIYKWLELPATEDEIEEVKEAIGINEEYEEWFITDYETDIEGLQVGEYEDLETLNELAERYENLEDYEQDAVTAVIEAHGYDLVEALDIVEEGRYTLYSDCNSLEDLAQEFFDEGCFGDTEAMGKLVNYIDFERLGRDLGYDGYTETSKGVVLVD